MILLLLKQEANLDEHCSNDSSPLRKAVDNGHAAICKLPLRRDSVSSLAQISFLIFFGHASEEEASCSGPWDMAALLRQEESSRKGIDVLQRGDLELAIEEDHLPRNMKLLEIAANLNQPNGEASTPLNQAFLLGKDSITGVHLEYNANITVAMSDRLQTIH